MHHDGCGCCLPGVVVKDAEQAHAAAVSHGAHSVQAPVTLTDPATGQKQTVAEVVLYGDVVLRLVSGPFQVHCSSLDYF